MLVSRMLIEALQMWLLHIWISLVCPDTAVWVDTVAPVTVAQEDRMLELSSAATAPVM